MSDPETSNRPTERPPGVDSSAGSTGKNSPTPIPPSENQPTVISNRPLIPASSHSSRESDVEPPAVHAELIKSGTQLGDIELIEHIGGGGMGQVYRGKDKRLGRSVAVKVLSRDQSADQDAVRRFLKEARSAARLNHHHIAQVYSAGEANDHPYIVFEFVEGVNIRSLIDERGPLPLEEALSYTLQIADALAHAAEQRIVHRDVKPSNVLIGPNGQAKLIDLGLARLNDPNSSDGDLTASGVTLGTFDYISPEQARDPRNTDSRSDIYSLGCTLFYMLAGRPPFPEGTVLQKLLQHQGDEPPDVCQFRPDLPEEAGQVLGKMMAKDPRRRYPDVARLMEALLTLADLIGLQPTGPAQTIWLPPQESRISVLQRQMPWLAPATVLACLVGMLHFFWSSPDEAADLAMQSFFDLGARAVPTSSPPDFRTSKVPEPNSVNSGDSQNGVPSGEPSEGSAPESRAEAGQPAGVPETSAVNPDNPGEGLLSGLSDNIFGEIPVGQSLKPESLAGTIGQPVANPGISLTMDSAASRAAGLTVAQLGISPAATSPDEPDEPAAPAVALIITPEPQGESQFATIRDALAAHPQASLLELRFDGRQTEKPLVATGRRLTIRAGSGNEPVLVFRPSGSDPALCPRDMIRVTDGELHLTGIALELGIPRNMPSAAWSLIRLSAGGGISLSNCSLTVRNASESFEAYHQDVAFFRIAPAETPESGPSADPDSPPKARMGLDNCIIRGEAGLIRIEGDVALDLNWQNGLLATTGPALSIHGSSRTAPPDADVRLQWEHVTAVTRQSLIALNFNPHQPRMVPVRLSNFACVVTSRGAPLIRVVDAEDANSLLARLAWSGDGSLLAAGAAPLVLEQQLLAPPADEESVIDWAAQWAETAGLSERVEPIPWLGPLPVRAAHSLEPDDFALDPTALIAGPEGEDAPGFQAELLPVLPLEPVELLDSPPSNSLVP